MDKKVSMSELKQAYIQCAKIISIHGEVYLPIFERLEKEFEDRKKEKDLLTKAISISKSHNID